MSVIEKILYEKKEEKKERLDKLICFMKYSLNENGHYRTHLIPCFGPAWWVFPIHSEGGGNGEGGRRWQSSNRAVDHRTRATQTFFHSLVSLPNVFHSLNFPRNVCQRR